MSHTKIIAAAFTALLAATASAQPMDAQQAHDNTVKIRQVSYSCQGNRSLTVQYGFNAQGLPTYAQANVNGKQRFMPINLGRSDTVDTVFGDENNFSLSASAITLNNYHRTPLVGIMSPGSEFTHKSCTPRSSRRIKG